MPDRYDGIQIKCYSMPYNAIQCHTMPYNSIVNTIPDRDTMIWSRYNVVAVGEVGDERLGILGGLG
jgi:hypothetical protein